MYYRYWLHQKVRPGHFGIRNARYKLIFFYGQPLGMPGTNKEITEPNWEFFDLQNDPTESKNAYHDPKYATIIKEMKEELIRQKQLAGDSDNPYPIMIEIMDKHWD